MKWNFREAIDDARFRVGGRRIATNRSGTLVAMKGSATATFLALLVATSGCSFMAVRSTPRKVAGKLVCSALGVDPNDAVSNDLIATVVSGLGAGVSAGLIALTSPLDRSSMTGERYDGKSTLEVYAIPLVLSGVAAVLLASTVYGAAADEICHAKLPAPPTARELAAAAEAAARGGHCDKVVEFTKQVRSLDLAIHAKLTATADIQRCFPLSTTKPAP